MTVTELQARIEALQAALDTKTQEQNAYRGQIDTLKKQLEDLNKPQLTPKQFDDIREAIEEGVGQFDFDDTDNYSYDFHIFIDVNFPFVTHSKAFCDSVLRILNIFNFSTLKTPILTFLPL